MADKGIPEVPIALNEIKPDNRDPLDLDVKALPYTKFYCEENIWKLAEHISNKCTDFSKCYVIISSNDKKKVPFFHHKTGKAENMYMQIWDYHLIIIWKESKEQIVVYDLDTNLPFPMVFDQYKQLHLQPDIMNRMTADFQRSYRILKAQDFLNYFASDRSHMIESNGSYYAPPPPHDPIRTEHSTHTLDELVAMKKNTAPGHVCDEESFIKIFSP
ncbi:Protein N-terminal glutamine amidohydrolase isoform X1 [Oopsacas minuta]|uniref:Protein N-terminal glutamine amidohydrolase n=1 Tax=Oopsacas minuta TaxID=111878 RepID=A0AAV7JKK8_9METZ|nr:Protein N-terminal glutamine amidohydrolase isoform X1 [Oopsacas minuta]